jgi:hypothetical protein
MTEQACTFCTSFDHELIGNVRKLAKGFYDDRLTFGESHSENLTKRTKKDPDQNERDLFFQKRSAI